MALWNPYGYYGGYGDHPLHQHHRSHNPFALAENMFDTFDSMFEVPTTWLNEMLIRDRPLTAGRTTEISNTGDQFKINLNVEGFRPEELNLKVIRDRFVVIQGKKDVQQQPLREGEEGFVHQEFTRSFVIPKGVDVSQIRSNLSRDGVLTIQAPKVDLPAIRHERQIAIEQGESAKQITGENI